MRSDRPLWSARLISTFVLAIVAIIGIVAIVAPRLVVAVAVLFFVLWALSAPMWLRQIGQRMRR